MSSISKPFGFLFHLQEFVFKDWLSHNSLTCLKEIGVREGQTVLDLGCGSGDFTVSSATLVGETGTVYALDIDDRALDILKNQNRKKRFQKHKVTTLFSE